MFSRHIVGILKVVSFFWRPISPSLIDFRSFFLSHTDRWWGEHAAQKLEDVEV